MVDAYPMPTDRKFKDITGQVFGRLTVLELVGRNGKSRAYRWRCRCACGRETVVAGTTLRYGNTTSCGCYDRERRFTHGMSKARVFSIWKGMLQRCNNPKAHGYDRYGGRGIKVCARWLKFENFLADMGEPPVGLTLDRSDNDGEYCQQNCRWATPIQQMNNMRRNIRYVFCGKSQTIPQWARELGFAPKCLYGRIYNLRWSIERALTTPARPTHNRRR